MRFEFDMTDPLEIYRYCLVKTSAEGFLSDEDIAIAEKFLDNLEKK